MSDLAKVLAQLERRGLIRPGATPVTGGNSDRRPEAVRTRWRAESSDNRPILLTVGPGTAQLATRQFALAAAFPKLVGTPVFFDDSDSVPVLAEPWFEGEKLETILERNGPVSPHLVESFRELIAHLGNATEPSTPTAREREYAEWSEQIAGLPLWSTNVSRDLRDRVLPRLGSVLSETPPRRRWTNGDFTSANLLYSDQAGFRLIDAEYAASTHFFAEDAARFFALSPQVRRRPNLFSALRPPGPASQLFFWLRQLALECAANQPAYLARILPRRLAIVRRLIEVTLELELPEWPTPVAEVRFHLEGAEWRQTASHDVHFRGWCTVPDFGPLTAITVGTALEESGASTPIRRPDVQNHFGGEPAALDSGFDLVACARPEDRLFLLAKSGEGELLPFHSVLAGDLPGRDVSWSGYGEWRRVCDPDPGAPSVSPQEGPLFSLLLPVYRTPRHLLSACLRSVAAQQYPRWELCVVDDSGGPGEWRDCLREFADHDTRVRLLSRDRRGGIAEATNAALAMSRGEFVAMLDHDDELRPHALLEFVRALKEHPNSDVIYSDEDKIDGNGLPVIPSLKPDWSPEYFRGVMYVGHLLAVRRELALAVGGFDSNFDGVQDFEFMLRISERTNRILHVPRILYYWRQWESSSALVGNAKGDMDLLQQKAVQAHLDRSGDPRTARALGAHRVALIARHVPTFSVHRFAADPLPAIRLALAESDAPVIIIAHTGLELPEPTVHQLAALACRPDSGFVGPVILDPAGSVIEAGRTIAATPPTRLMTGFAGAADGFNGSLRCNREVSLVSPECFAVRREAAGHIRSGNWVTAATELAQLGLRHRICAAAHVVASRPALPSSQPIRSGCTDPFFNPHFDPLYGDFRLARPSAHLSPRL